MSNHPDHPKVRASSQCPVCDNRKEFGKLTCSPCWASRNPDFVLGVIDAAERMLAKARGEAS